MNTNTATQANDTTTTGTGTGTKSWYRRPAAAIGVAAALTLALGLSACGTDQAVKRTSVDAETTTTVAAPTTTSTVDVPAPSNTGAAQTSNGGNTGSSGSSGKSGSGNSGNPGSGNPGNTDPQPVINGFWTPGDIDCHNGNFQQFSVNWETTNAVKVTISIDGAGVYSEYPADGDTSLPFNCSSSHNFLLTAYGTHGQVVTRSVTLAPRNVQVDTPEGDDPTI